MTRDRGYNIYQVPSRDQNLNLLVPWSQDSDPGIDWILHNGGSVPFLPTRQARSGTSPAGASLCLCSQRIKGMCEDS